MLRAIWFLFVLTGLAVVAMWLANDPGQLRLQWRGYVVETSAAMLFAAFVVIAFVATLLSRLWLFLRGVPAGIRRYRQDGRRRRGYLALTRGMVAVAAGDAAEARVQGGRADGLLGDPSLTMLLSAQAAQLNGDEQAAEKFFTAMLERPEMEFLGLRGLLSQASRRGDTGQALKWARRAHRIKPKSEWLGDTLFKLLTEHGLWAEAESALTGAVKNKAIAPPLARRRQAVLDHLLSIEAEAAGNSALALKKAAKAFEKQADFIPAVVRYAGLLTAAGKSRKALAALERAWRAKPHPDIAQAYRQAAGAKDDIAAMKTAQKLASCNPDHGESLKMLAAAGLAAGLWGEARQALNKLIAAAPPTVAACRMMAELEERENGDLAAAREWLLRVGNAAPDAVWLCRQCGNTAAQWSALCGKCRSFDGFQWSPPLNVPALAAPAEHAAADTIAPADESGLLQAHAPAPAAPVAMAPPPPGGKKPQDIDEKSAGR